MTNHQTSSAKKTFYVWASSSFRMYQEVEAENAWAAYEIARAADKWEVYDLKSHLGYRLWNCVRDVEADRLVVLRGRGPCKTCGMEIVEDVNDSRFRDGECGTCEERRYRSQPKLLDACKGMTGLMHRDKHDRETMAYSDYQRAERACRDAITEAERGHAA